jgi:putative transposase
MDWRFREARGVPSEDAPKAVAKLTSHKESLLSFYDYPVEHWRHLRTTNPIESVFTPVRVRTEITKGSGSR